MAYRQMRDEANEAARLKLEKLKAEDPAAYRLMRDGENEAQREAVRTHA